MLGTTSLLLAATVLAPGSETGRTLLGGQFGFDISHVVSYGIDHQPSGTGGVGAVYVTLPLSRHFSIQPDLSIVRKDLYVRYRSDRQIQLPFGELTTLAVFSQGFERSYLFAGAGPALALRIGARGPDDLVAYYGSPIAEWRRSTLEVVAMAGVGVYASQSLAFRLEARYVHGLQDLDPAADYSDPTTSVVAVQVRARVAPQTLRSAGPRDLLYARRGPSALISSSASTTRAPVSRRGRR